MINHVLSLCRREQGSYAWKNYDSAIQKLRCHTPDQFMFHPFTEDGRPCDPLIFASKFADCHGHETKLALADETGQLVITETDHRNPKDKWKAISYAHNNAIFDLAWMPGSMKLVTASGDHTAKLFSLENTTVSLVRTFHGHDRSVKSVSFRTDDPAVFATGGRDGQIFLWDLRTKIPADRVIGMAHNVPTSHGSSTKKRLFYSSFDVGLTHSVTSVVYQNDMTLISAAAGDGLIKVWDMRKHYSSNRKSIPKHSLPYAGQTMRKGFSCLTIDNSQCRLYANCLDSNIYCYNISTYQQQPIMTYKGHRNNSYYIKSSMSADGMYLISGSHNSRAYIWNTNKSTPIAQLLGHEQEVTSVAWRQTGHLTVATCSDDMRYFLWRADDQKNRENDENYALLGHAEPVTSVQKTVTILTPKKVAIMTPPSLRPRPIPLATRIENMVATSIRRAENLRCETITSGALNRSHNKSPAKMTITPTSLKRNRICENCQMLTPSETEHNCENCNTTTKKQNKRPAEDALLGSYKKRTVDKCGPRKLFPALPEQESSEELAIALEDPPTEEEFFSPTMNLPNFVMDGDAPHLGNFSPEKPHKNTDWLTLFRKEHDIRTQMELLNIPSTSGHRGRSDASTSSAGSNTRRNKNSKQVSDPRRSPLFKYLTSPSQRKNTPPNDKNK